MARPAPTILLEQVDTLSLLNEQVIYADAIYAVFYNNNPINLKTIDSSNNSNVKYKKASFSNSAHAIRLAKRLNKKFNTINFTARKLTSCEIIFKDSPDNRDNSIPVG